jgi:O-antigen/teichoic acid export membrane protein
MGLLLVGIGIEILNLAFLGWWTKREIGINLSDKLAAQLRRRLVRYNLALAAIMLLNAIVWQRSEVLFLGRFSGTDQVAFYSLPFALTEKLTDLLPGALLGVMLPGLAYAQAAADPARFAAVFSEALRALAMLTLPICLVGIPLASIVISILYGPGFGPAVVVLQILLLATIFGVAGQAASSALLGLEAQSWLLKTGAAAAAISIGLDLALIPKWGAIGAAVANGVAQATWAIAAFVPLWKRGLISTRRLKYQPATNPSIGGG